MHPFKAAEKNGRAARMPLPFRQPSCRLRSRFETVLKGSEKDAQGATSIGLFEVYDVDETAAAAVTSDDQGASLHRRKSVLLWLRS